ncbi:MAG TPA: DUF5309 family protein [Gemmatimonadales bacterium]|nr:DUF5309 family protein [Gemmatimonadales bacterium]
MATTINSGLVDTADPLANELKVDMREKIAMLDPDTSQFTTMLMKLPQERASSFKVEWMNDELIPQHSALAASAASADTNITVTTSEGSYFKAGDILRFADTGEPVRVTGVAASSLTVVRAVDGSTAASAQTGTKIIRVGGSNEQGATLPTALITQRATNYNYTQIVRNSYRFTETAIATQWYGGPLVAKERRKKAVEHKWEIENMLFFGARSYSAGTNNPRHTAGGLLHYVTNESDTDTLTEVEFQDFLRHGLEYGSKRKVLFASPLVAQVLSSFLEDRIQPASTRPNPNIWGVKVDSVISGVVGQEIPVIVKREWKRYGESAGQYGTYACLVDLDYVQLAPLRDTVLKPNRQANDADEQAAEFITELSLKVERPEVHRWLVDVTGAA